jgi:hypothetical protein
MFEFCRYIEQLHDQLSIEANRSSEMKNELMRLAEELEVGMFVILGEN